MQESGEMKLKLVKNDLSTLAEAGLEPVDKSFIGACRSLNANLADYKMPQFIERNIEPVDISNSDKLLLLFSGGKVSLATALMLRELHKDVTLFHVDESGELTFRINKMAEKLKLPLVVSIAKFKGKYRHLFYGMNLAHTALSYALENGYSPRIYMGCFEMASVYNNERKNWRYCTELMDAYVDVIKKYIVGADVVRMMPNYSVVDDTFIRYKDYLEFFA